MLRRMAIPVGLLAWGSMIMWASIYPNTASAFMGSATPTPTSIADHCPIRTDADDSIVDVERNEIFLPLLEPPFTIGEFETRTLEFLNAGGDPLRLQDLWRNQDAEISVREHDLDKDGSKELLIAVRLRGYEHFGGIALLSCIEGRYRFADWIMNGPYEYDPQIITIEDLNHDGKNEVILTETWSGSAYDQQFWVIGWQDAQIEWFLDNVRLVCPVRWMVQDVDADGTKEIVLEGHRSSPQSGDHRRVTETYALKEENYVLSSRIPSDPVTRVHYIEDGYEALKSSDIIRAVGLYEIAVFNKDFIVLPHPRLTNNSTVEDETYRERELQLQLAYIEGKNEWAFAHFRLLTLYYAEGQTRKTGLIYQRMEKYFSNDYGYEFLNAAKRFIVAWNSNHDSQKACKIANQLLRGYTKRPIDDSRIPKLSFTADYLTYDWRLSNWCFIPTDSPPISPVVSPSASPDD
jgi:hypothetical protein